MAGPLEETHQRRQARADQARLAKFVRQGGNKRLAALRAPLPLRRVLLDPHRQIEQLHLLDRPARLPRVPQLPSAARTLRIMPQPLAVQRLPGKRRALVTRMPGLATDASFLRTPPLPRLMRRLDNVAGRRLRGIARVLLSLGQRRLQRRHQRFQRSHARLQLSATRTTSLPFAFRHNGG